MKLEDIDYFAVKKTQQPDVFNLAQKVVDESAKDPVNYTEIQHRLTYLAKSTGNEHLRQLQTLSQCQPTFSANTLSLA